jgi:thioredoxin-like negative regulator of GroEL
VTIEKLTQQRPAVAIQFWAPWNGTDPLMDRSIQIISGRFAGRVVFVSCNVDREENGELCQRCGVKNIPALGLLISGHQPVSIIGYRDPETLAGEIESWLNESARKAWWALWR